MQEGSLFCIKLNIPLNIQLKGNWIPITILLKSWHFHCDMQFEPSHLFFKRIPTEISETILTYLLIIEG